MRSATPRSLGSRRGAEAIARAALKRLRAICLELPDVLETTTFGHPTFQAGKKKTFAVLDDHERKDTLCLVFKVSLAEQRRLTQDPRFFPSKFGARHGWTSLVIDADVDWDEVEPLLVQSYRLVASKRLVARLDAR